MEENIILYPSNIKDKYSSIFLFYFFYSNILFRNSLTNICIIIFII